MTTSLKPIVRQTTQSLDISKRWKIIEDYLQCKLSNNDIAEKYQVSVKTVETTVQETYKKFQNVRETKTLLATQKRPDVFLQLKSDHIDSSRINQSFLDALSEPDSYVLTDSEMIFCELFVNNGDELQAVEEAGLHVGLNKRDPATYKEAVRLRAFYLRRKPNVAQYLNEIRKKLVVTMENGKTHLQAELLALVEKLRNSSDSRSTASLLKSIELLGKSIGAFDEKITVDNISSDEALDRLMHRMKRADVIEVD